MRVLIVVGIFPPDYGGPATYVPSIGTALMRRGHDVRVVCLSDSLDYDDARFLFPVTRVRRGAFRPLRWVATFLTLLRWSRWADVVYVNGLGMESAVAATLARKPAVHKVVSDSAWERAVGRGYYRGSRDAYQDAHKAWRLRVLDLLRAWPLLRAAHIIVPSEYVRGLVRRWGIRDDRVSVIYNASTADVTARAPHRVNESELPSWGGKTLITIGRLIPLKGIDRIIEVLPMLDVVRLVIVGDGPQREELAELANRLGVMQRVVFVGAVASERVQPLLRQADAFVLNSETEGFPHVVLEAMAAGVPVVATKTGGTQEVVRDGHTGLLVPVGDQKGLIGAIVAILGDRDASKDLVDRARQELTARFSQDRMVNDTEALLLTVSNRRGAPARFEMGGSNRTVAMTDVAVLSLGSTRGLWADGDDEDRRRLTSYSTALRAYVVLVHGRRRPTLPPIRIGGRLQAISTNSVTRFDSVLRMVWLGARAIRRERVSLIQAQDPVLSGLPALVLSRLFRLPLNVCVYGTNAFDPHWRRAHWLNWLLAPLGRFVLRRASGIQVDGRMTAESLVRNGVSTNRIRIKPMVPSDLDRFFALDRRSADAQRRTRLLFVGRLHRQKNLGMLADVLALVGERSELLVVGDGPERRRFEKRLRRNGVATNVRWWGQVGREQVLEAFREADVLVLCSYYEGFPRVLMEGVAAGLPIVTTRVGGSDEMVIDGKTGFIVPVDDAQACAEKIVQLVENPALRVRMGEGARRHIARVLETVAPDARQISIWEECLAFHRTTDGTVG